MVTMLMVCLLGGVNYDLIDYDLVSTEQVDYDLVSTRQVDYSLFTPTEIKPESNNTKTKTIIVNKPKFEWTFPGHTRKDLERHLKTHPNHSKTFKDIDLSYYDFQTLKDMHGYHHETMGTSKSLFKSECTLFKTKTKRILFFKAKWCGACSSSYASFAPWLRKSGWTIGPTTDNHIQVIDIDENPELASRYKIGSLPTFIVIDNDRTIKKISGSIPKEQVPRLLTTNINN